MFESSACGWYAELKSWLVTLRLKISFEKWLVKMALQSLTMLWDSPKNLKILSINSRVTPIAVYGWDNSKKWLYLLNVSIINIMTLYPLDRGNPLMKSILMSTYALLGTDNGCNSLTSLRFSVWFLWHTLHSLINFLASLAFPSKKIPSKLLNMSSEYPCALLGD